MLRKKYVMAAVIITAFMLLVGCNKYQADDNQKKELKISRENFMLDTVISITLYGTEDDALFNDVFEEIARLENLLSIHKENSDLYNIRENASKKYTKVSDETIKIIEMAAIYSEATDGLFDVTSGPLIKLWGIGTEDERVPSGEEISKAVKLIDYKKININKESNEVMLADSDMFIDLGAVAKGYIADKACEKIKSLGIENAIINLGGNVKLLGSKPDGSDFGIGIQDPNGDRGAYLGVLAASGTSIVTSGDYERYFEKDGIRYHHILDASTGYPSNNDLKSVSIVTENSLEADALSTSVLLLGLEMGYGLIENTENTEAIFVTKDNKIIMTDKLKDKFQLTSKEYEIIPMLNYLQ